MSLQDKINIHGRLKFINKLGHPVTLFGYIREVNGDSILWQDNEFPDKFKIRNIEDFTPMKLPII
ncbi:MAG: hypothetical protein ABFC18_03235 [Rikenellaceae bacterium]